MLNPHRDLVVLLGIVGLVSVGAALLVAFIITETFMPLLFVGGRLLVGAGVLLLYEATSDHGRR